MDGTGKDGEGRHGFMEIFRIYLRLGCMAFGGPVAHLGYFKEEFVNRRRWLSAERYTELLGLCQFLPGPSSSQLGFAIGWQKGGAAGAAAAWLGFTLPSALIMIACGYGILSLGPEAGGPLRGLLAAAVAVVANAVIGLAPKLCPDLPRILIAATAAGAALLAPGSATQVAVIAAGGMAGYLLFRRTAPEPGSGHPVPAGRRTGTAALVLFALLLLPALAVSGGPGDSLLAAHFRAGSLVFGGGHVVLPLLHEGLVAPGRVAEATFLSGYSAAQALPGPLFTFGAYLGTVTPTTGAPWLGGLLSLGAIFLPGILLVVGVVPFWERLRGQAWARAGLPGANAAVVGLLLAVLIDPVATRGIGSTVEFVIALAAFATLYTKRLPAWCVVLLAGGTGWLLHALPGSAN